MSLVLFTIISPTILYAEQKLSKQVTQHTKTMSNMVIKRFLVFIKVYSFLQRN